MSRKKQNKKHLDADEYAKGVQISISLSKNMLIDPYFVKGERFYKMRITLRYLEPLLALGILFSFFLPWTVNNLSAYELLKLDNFKSTLSLISIIPLCSLLLMFLSNFSKLKRFLSIVFGLFSFFLIKVLINSGKFGEISFVNFSHGFYIYLFLSILLIVLPFYKIFNKTTLLNKKKIAFNSKLLKPWLAFGLLGSFFLPWLKFNFLYVSGYALLFNEAFSQGYWVIGIVPFFSTLLLLSYKFNMKLKVISFFTGITPYIVIIIFFLISEQNPIICFGAYLSMVFGAGLTFLSIRTILK